MPAPPYPVSTLVALAAERILVLLAPRHADPPFPRGATPAEWGRAIGLGCSPRSELGAVDPIDVGPHDAESIALLACRRLAQRGALQKRRSRLEYLGRIR